MFLRRRKNLCEHTTESGKISQGEDGIGYSTHERLRCPMIFFSEIIYGRLVIIPAPGFDSRN